jgi:hypothetical protein
MHFSRPHWKLHSSFVVSTALLLVLAGCNGAGSPTEPDPDPGPVDNSPGVLTVNVIATQPLSAAPIVSQSTSGVPDPVLAVSRARFLLREIRIHSVSDEMIEVNSDPQIVGLHLGGVPIQIATMELAQGTYDRLDVKVHRLDDTDPVDQPYFSLPEFGDFNDATNPSAIIEGTYDPGSGAVSFTFRSDSEGEQQKNLPAPFQVGANQRVNLTIRIDQNTWFSDGAGGLLDPADPLNQGWISSNIVGSIEVFLDQDRNGHPD